ncbi:uncharacterized protein LAESUDRAFT_167348 [Laetiporus sulphureus 93-53]|uniref:Uncharacterized protein n=1 Tax=Laetiporus sulphureus 93-53 TaxID=1314785 RepID=A0A165HSJ8_9APHY|nr:uncharacterized protein LAESUDRAFT_167348 [Laetiporus sulphureus 93-53]KZT12128.1 hypothetical protein LAESUDRAFT_167348 [Laetiporus sulphureus 93-53]
MHPSSSYSIASAFPLPDSRICNLGFFLCMHHITSASPSPSGSVFFFYSLDSSLPIPVPLCSVPAVLVIVRRFLYVLLPIGVSSQLRRVACSVTYMVIGLCRPRLVSYIFIRRISSSLLLF